MPKWKLIYIKELLLSALACFFALVSSGYCEEESPLFWPPPPAQMKITFVKSVYSPADVGIKQSLFRKIKKTFLGENKDILSKPLAVAVDGDRTIYICDPGLPGVHIFARKEKRSKKITAINKDKLLSPVSAAVSDDGLIFIADSKLRKVFCIDKNYRFKFEIGGGSVFLRPAGLTISSGKLYVVDTGAHAVMVFDLSGNFLLRFGARGKEPGEFNFPTAIISDSAGRIYIADTLNFRIQVFDENNKFLYSIGQSGDSSGSFARPKGVAVDSFNHIYVADGIFDNIQIFNQKKEFLLSWGGSGQKDGEFWIISGIAVDKDNYIYAADSYNQRIQIFHFAGKE